MDGCIKQIPKIEDDKICPFCGSMVSLTTNANLMIYNEKLKKQKEIERVLYCCEKCSLSFISYKQYQLVCKMYGYKPERFVIKNDYSLVQVRAKMYSPPVWSFDFQTVKQTHKIPNKNKSHHSYTQPAKKTRDIKSVNLQKLPKIIYKTNYVLRECPACNHKLMDYVNVIPINENECLPYNGKFCASCGKFYEEGYFKVEKFIDDNLAEQGYGVKYDYFIPKYIEHYSSFCELESPVVFAVLSEKSNQCYRYISIVCKKEEVNTEYDILHYSDPVSRVILTSIFYKKESIKLDGINYVVSKICVNSECEITDFKFFLKEIKLKKGGGYANYNRDEIVDVLLYSPRTELYEIVRASYNRSEDEYYMDINLFRKFINLYGNPGLPILFSSPNSNEFGFCSLKEESLLYAYGYTVSQSEGLYDAYRWKLLGEIMDLGLMEPYEIVNLLSFNINSHSANKYLYARMKWKKDIEFVSNYKVNPDRFVIADEVKK